MPSGTGADGSRVIVELEACLDHSRADFLREGRPQDLPNGIVLVQVDVVNDGDGWLIDPGGVVEDRTC